ncbi:translation initiation factor IF-2 [Sporobacter termitidis DSM 10068]|uniref:Translation initiation factor IF-2 n=1 Tax=Sporobacter termitidis DSM 10068 TaxID=1123282 RepID=A0A1M5XXP9_9FIRM|nr:translation initiation factor IF-2 [Sporobacter termitidis]SHI04469.1 translation initiation factor IF-2 [Sporobacter termitidis DSM 10068]
MSTMFKYRVHEVAKDFKVPTKVITEVLTEYAATPKNHMQVLTTEELDLIFEYLTQHHQVASIEEIFAVASPSASEPAEKPAAKETPAGRPAPGQRPDEQKKPAPSAPAHTERQTAPAPRPENQQQQQQPVKKPDKPFVPRQAPQKRVIDTSGATINIDKYDERLDNLVPERAERIKSGKEKFTNKKNQSRGQTMASGAKRRQEERERMQRLQFEVAKKAQLKVSIPDEIGVGELASRMKKTGAEVVKQLIKLGVMASLSDIIDYDTAALVAIELGCKVEHEVVVTIEERLIDDHADKEEDLVSRAPIVVVMGHVDHGKTSLLDKIREANVVAGEAGGITQHIGAYRVAVNGSPITFLDTPGHEAFTSMRARGAMVTDIAILVVAADDGIMPQTVESINHAKAAKIPIIVAINKMDVPGANPDRIKQQLTEYELVSDEWGGDTVVVPISAKTGMGIDRLLEMVVLTAEMQELRANPDRAARGTVIEARLDKGRGPIMTVLVQNGTLKLNDIIIAGTAVGHVRVMTNDRGERVSEAGPSVPVEISGMSEVPDAGDTFNAVADERMARELVEQRKAEKKNASATSVKVSLEDLFSRIQQGELKDLNIIVKADVQGSAEAIKSSLVKLSNDEVRVRVIHSGVGAISESDVMLAATSGAIVVGFNVRPDNAARDSAVRSNVDIRMYRVIYDAINEIEAAMKGMLAPKFKEVVLGHAEVRQIFKASNIGTICGSYVTDGKIIRNCKVRVIRDHIVIHEGELASLRRFKDDVKEVATNYECGLSIEKFNDVKEGDVIEAFIMEQIKD